MRQPHIVDFYCAAEKLVIELDGDNHFLGEALKRDFIRDEFLIKNHSIKILRFLNFDVMNNFESVCEEIEEYLKQNTGSEVIK